MITVGFARFNAGQPVAAASIGPSVVRTGAQGSAPSLSGSPTPSGGSPAADATANAVLGYVALGVLVVTVALGVFWYRRRVGTPHG